MKYKIITLLLFLTFISSCSEPPTAPTPPKEQPEPTPSQTTQQHFNPDAVHKLLLAELALNQQQTDIAIQHYLSLARDNRNSDFAKHATQLAISRGDIPTALEASIIWASKAPSDQEAQYFTSVLLLSVSRYDDALPYLETLLTNPYQDTSLNLLMLAAQLGGNHAIEKLLKATKSIAEKYPDNQTPQLSLAMFRLQAKQYDLALISIDRVLKLKPDWSKAIMLRAQIMMKTGQKGEAFVYLKTQLRKQSKNHKLRYFYAQRLLDNRNLREAKRQFSKLKRIEEYSGKAYLHLAEIARLKHQKSKSKNYLLKALDKPKQADLARYLLGQFAAQEKKYDRAIRWFSAVEAGPHNFEAQIRTAELMAKQGKTKEARKFLNRIQATTLFEQKKLALTHVGIMLAAKKPSEALSLINNMLKILPKDYDLIYARSIAADRLHRYDEAEKDLKEIIKHNPKHAHALNTLGYSLANRTDRYQEALSYIERALVIVPNNAAIIDSMGWIQYRLGNHKEALKYLKRAAKLSDDTEIAVHLGEVLWITNNQEAAQKVWQQSLKKFPGDKHLLKAIKRFKNIGDNH